VVFNCKIEICRVYLENTAGSSIRAYMMQPGFSTTADIKAEINPFGYYSFRGKTPMVILIVNIDPTIANTMSISYSDSQKGLSVIYAAVLVSLTLLAIMF